MTQPRVRAKLAQLDGSWRHERRLLGVLIRLAFGLAGLCWLPLLWLQMEGASRTAFTLTQYQLYVVLLTLWGYDYRRQLRRVECILECATKLQRLPENVTWEDIASCGCADRFDVLRRHPKSRAWFPVAFTWGLLVGAYLWLGRQIAAIVGMLVSA
jgi:hypothetical protein